SCDERIEWVVCGVASDERDSPETKLEQWQPWRRNQNELNPDHSRYPLLARLLVQAPGAVEERGLVTSDPRAAGLGRRVDAARGARVCHRVRVAIDLQPVHHQERQRPGRRG